MDLYTLRDLQSSNPAWSLLRKTNAPFIIGFLIDAFKTKARVEIPSDTLSGELAAYQSYLNEEEIDALKGSPETILSEWASDSEQILWRTYDSESDTYVFALRNHSQDVIAFVTEMVAERQPLATETSLKQIFTMMDELVMLGHGDVEAHIAKLESKREALQRDIERITENGLIDKNPTDVRNLYRNLLSAIKALSGDFRKVEEDFRSVAVDIQNEHIGESANRGDVLKYMLDHDELIRNSDQGKSFYGFLSLLNSPAQLAKLDELRLGLSEIPEIADFDSSIVRNFERGLLQEAQRVNRTVQRLSRQLRRVLDDKANAQRQRLLADIQEILGAFSQEEFSVDKPDEFMEVEALPHLQMLDDFSPYRPRPELKQSDAIVYEADQTEEEKEFDTLVGMKKVDYERLISNIHRTFGMAKRETITLPDVIEHFPLTFGLIEVAGYLQLAHENNAKVDQHNKVRLEVKDDNDITMELEVPNVTFKQSEFNPELLHS